MPSRRTRITIALLWRRSWNQEPTPNTIPWLSSDHAGANAPVSPAPANLGSRPAFAASKGAVTAKRAYVLAAEED